MTGPSDAEATRPFDARPDATEPIGSPPGEPPAGGRPAGGPPDDEDRGRQWWLYALLALLVGIAVGVGIALATSGGDDKADGTTTSSSTTTSSTTTTTAPPPTSPPTAAPTPPGQVNNLTAEAGGGSGEVSLHWDSVPGAVSYRIYRSNTSGTSGALIATVNDTSYVDTPGAHAYYQVSAVNSAGQEGPRSVEACGAPVGDSC